MPIIIDVCLSEMSANMYADTLKKDKRKILSVMEEDSKVRGFDKVWVIRSERKFKSVKY
jgi:hypothetical protein